MPFMLGKSPVRFTLEYLKEGRLFLRDKIKVFTVNYNNKGEHIEHHAGAKEFVFWYIPQIQYQNPAVQVATFKNLTPSPFIKCYFEDGGNILIDIDGRPKEQIMDHLIQVVGKSNISDSREYIEYLQDSTANFGAGCLKHCICGVRGQVPCPGVIPLPKHMRGKFKNQTN